MDAVSATSWSVFPEETAPVQLRSLSAGGRYSEVTDANMELARSLDLGAERGRATGRRPASWPTAGRPYLHPLPPPPARDPSRPSSRRSSQHPRVVSGSAYISPPARQKLGHPRHKSLASPAALSAGQSPHTRRPENRLHLGFLHPIPHHC